ncbi:MAG: hypothetical protein EKK59_02585 [Neisseriaceae bacterium]|jgi:hypothetical protein|nr:hypothetical protein [Pseudomonadota bacterium]RTL01777.1 MAG: hypothetical protein EKK59_02585 [Neisseriaceae bacterium]
MSQSPKRPRGRPVTGHALSGAERARQFRLRKKQGSFGAELAREDFIRCVTEIQLMASYEERRLRKQYALGIAYGLRMAGYLDEVQLSRISEWIRAI